MGDGLRAILALLLAWRRRLSVERVGAAIVYHEVGGRGLDADVFRAQVRHVARRYRPVQASDLLDAVRSRRRFGRVPVAITFDDDLPSHEEVAAPILREAGATATFFLGSRDLLLESLPRDAAKALIDAPPEARAGLEAEARPELTDDQRRSLADGFELGFHTLTHARLTGLSPDELRQALTEGRGEATSLAYPYGRADLEVARAAAEASFAAGFTVAQERVLPGSDPLLLGRLEPPPVAGGSFALQLARFVDGVVY